MAEGKKGSESGIPKELIEATKRVLGERWTLEKDIGREELKSEKKKAKIVKQEQQSQTRPRAQSTSESSNTKELINPWKWAIFGLFLALFGLTLMTNNELYKRIILIVAMLLYFFEDHFAAYLQWKIHIPEGTASPLLFIKLIVLAAIWVFVPEPMLGIFLVIGLFCLSFFTPFVTNLISNIKTKNEKGGIGGNVRRNAIIALIIAIISDLLDYFGAGLPIVGDIVDLITVALLYPLIGKASLPGFLEFIPGVDIFPTYTLLAIVHLFRVWGTSSTNDTEKIPKNITFREKGPSNGFTVIEVLIVLILLLIAIFFIFPFGGPLGQLDEGVTKIFGGWVKNDDGPISAGLRSIGRFFSWIKLGIDNMFNWLPKQYERAIAIGSGDYYTGQVDEKAKEKLGVYIEDIKPAQTEFYQNEPVTVWATLTAKTLDPDEPLTVSLGCDDKKNAGPNTKITPAILQGLSFLEKEGLQCEFGVGEIEVGSKPVYISARFDFQTNAYLKAHFMDKERSNSLKRDGQDPLVFYKVPNPNPVAIFTNGPVQIGMETLEPLIGIKTDTETMFTLGITLENLWEGKISELKSLTLKLPPPMHIVECAGNKRFDTVDCVGDECEDDRYQVVYKLNPQALIQINKKGGIKTFETFRCRVKLPPNSQQAILGNSPVMTHAIKAMATYRYELEESTVVTVKKSPGFSVYFSSRKPALKDTITCTGEHTETTLTDVHYKFYKADPTNYANELDVLSEGDQVCENNKCAIDFTLSGRDLKRGDLIGCRFEIGVKEATGSVLAGRRVTCSNECESKIEESGREYNTCFNNCMEKINTIQDVSTDVVRIENSKPEIKLEKTPEKVVKGELATILVKIIDADDSDNLLLGMQLDDETKTIIGPIQTCDSGQAAGCIIELTVPTNKDTDATSLSVSIPLSARFTTANKIKATIQFKEPEDTT